MSKEKKLDTGSGHVRESNRVIVRVWTSERNRRVPGRDVGHVSIELEESKCYISLWPAAPVSIKGPGIFTAVPPLYHSYTDDKREEKRIPERTVCLYSLHIDSLIHEFEVIKQSVQAKKTGELDQEDGDESEAKLTGWRLIGSNVLSRVNNSGGESCSSLAYRLLMAGGIYELISSKYSKKYSSIVSPDDLLLAIEDARKEELQRYLQIQRYPYRNPLDEADQEWVPQSVEGRHKISFCLTM